MLAGRGSTFGVTDAARDSRATIADELRAVADRVARACDRPVVHTMLDGVDVPRLLLEHARAIGARAIVMTTRAAGALGRALLGSVADRVTREATVPVVLVPPGAGTPARSAGALEPAPLGRVLIPLDGSRAARHAIDAVRSLDRAGTIELLLVEVQTAQLLTGIPAPDALRDPLAEARTESDALEGLEAVAATLRLGGREVRARVVTGGRPADAILAVAGEERVDLIAMTTRGRTGVARLALGSVADAVVRRAEVPVLLVTPGDAPVR